MGLKRVLEMLPAAVRMGKEIPSRSLLMMFDDLLVERLHKALGAL